MDVVEILLDILVVLVAAKIAAEIAERINVPAVVGEIVAGMLIGPSVLGLVGSNEMLERARRARRDPPAPRQVGMEMDIARARRGRAGVDVGRGASASSCRWRAASAVGVGVRARLATQRCSSAPRSRRRASASPPACSATCARSTTVEARTVLGAAVADDVLGLVILTVVVRIVSEGTVSVVDVARHRRSSRSASSWSRRSSARSSRRALFRAVRPSLALGGDAGRDRARVHAAASPSSPTPRSSRRSSVRSSPGSRSAQRPHPSASSATSRRWDTCSSRSSSSQIGIRSTSGRDFVEPEVLGIAGGLLVGRDRRQAARGGRRARVAGRQAAHRARHDPPRRGRADLRDHRPAEGILGEQLYAALLLVVLVTTLMAPPLLRWRLSRMRADPTDRAREHRADRRSEAGCASTTASVDLAGDAAARLRAAPRRSMPRWRSPAARARGARCSTGSARWSDAPLRWDADATQQLFDAAAPRRRPGVAVPRDHAACSNARFPSSPRQWTAGGPTRSCSTPPGVALHARRPDPRARVDRPGRGRRARAAASIRSGCCSPRSSSTPRARTRHRSRWPAASSQRLDLGAAAEQEIALLVGDSGLLRAAARKVDGLEEEAVLPARHPPRAARARPGALPAHARAR